MAAALEVNASKAAKRAALTAKIADEYAKAKAASEELASKKAAAEAAEAAMWEQLQKLNAEAGEEEEQQSSSATAAAVAAPAAAAFTTGNAAGAGGAAAPSFSPGDAVIFDNPKNGALELARVLAVHEAVASTSVVYTVQTSNGQQRQALATQLTISSAAPPPKVLAKTSATAATAPAPPAAAIEGNPHIYGYSKPGPRLGNGHHNFEGTANFHGPKKVHVPDLMLTSRGIGVPRNAKKGFRPGQGWGGGRKPNFGVGF